MDVISEIYSEVLLSLLGIGPSSIYQREMSLKELIPPAKLTILQRIAEVGERYCEIITFVNEKQMDELKNNGAGEYLLSCVDHLDKCLEPYRQEIYSLKTVPPSLSTLYSRIYPYDELLKGLMMMVREIKICDVRGTSILETLDKFVNTSIGGVRSALKFIHQGVSQLLFSQLLSWLLYGDIADARKEFFIQVTSPKSESPFERFSISHVLLPSFIRAEVADEILTVGQTVYFLRSRPEKTLGTNCLLIDSSGINIEKASEISLQMKQVAKTQSSQKWKLLEDVVKSVKTIVTTQLHTLAMKEANLVLQLDMIKDLFLLGRGELFHEFVNHIDFAEKSFTDFNLVLHACARKLLINENTLESFSLKVVPSQSGQLLSIHYDVPWPLELLFTPAVIDAYNHIFRFLLRIKRIQVQMVEAWLRDKSKRKLTSCAKRRQLQHNLWFLVNNLQYYLQVDVLDSQFMTLKAAVIASKDFDEIRLAHTRFLSNLTVQSFLDSPRVSSGIVNPVQGRLNNVIDLCQEFCVEAERIEDEEMPDDVVHSLGMKFDACFKRLFELLGALKNSSNPCGQHLGQLLLRLDFNRFLSLNPSIGGLDLIE